MLVNIGKINAVFGPTNVINGFIGMYGESIFCRNRFNVSTRSATNRLPLRSFVHVHQAVIFKKLQETSSWKFKHYFRWARPNGRSHRQ